MREEWHYGEEWDGDEENVGIGMGTGMGMGMGMVFENLILTEICLFHRISGEEKS